MFRQIILFIFVFWTAYTAGANELFKVNILKKISKSENVTSILSRRFEIESRQAKPNFEFLSWILQTLFDITETSSYKLLLEEYTSACSKQPDFSECFALELKRSVFFLKLGDYDVYWKSKNGGLLSENETMVLLSLYHFFPLNKSSKLYELIKKNYSQLQIPDQKLGTLKIYLSDGSNDSFIESAGLKTGMAPLEIYNSTGLVNSCADIMKNYEPNKFYLFVPCSLNYVRYKGDGKSVKYINEAIKSEPNNVWLKVMLAVLKKDSAIVPAPFRNSGTAAALALELSGVVGHAKPHINEARIGLPRFFKDLSLVQ